MDRATAAQNKETRRLAALQKLEADLKFKESPFPIPFDASGVQKYKSQEEAMKNVHYQRPRVVESSLEETFENMTLDEDDDSRDLTSIRNDKSETDAGSSYSTPSKRDQRKSDTAKSWLLGWLMHVGMFYCHISHTTAYAHLILQLAHILLPNATKPTHDMITFYEFILGMKYHSLCIHSRLFLMPLRSELHHSLDSHLFIILPHIDLLKEMRGYFRYVSGLRLEDGSELEDTWTTMRKGSLKGYENFTDGSIYQCRVIPHPFALCEVWEDLAYPRFFFTHTSPYALLLNAFRTLQVWATRQNGFRGTNALSCSPSEVLCTALQKLQILETEVSAIVSEVKGIYQTIGILRKTFDAERGKAWLKANKPSKDGSGSPGRRDRGSKENENSNHQGGAGGAGGNPNAFNQRLREHGLQGLEFSGGTRGGSNMSGEPREGMILSLSDVKLGSVWSADSLGDTLVAAESGLNDTHGPSPAQQIADDWRRAIPLSRSCTILSASHYTGTRSSLTAVGILPITKTYHAVYRFSRAEAKIRNAVVEMITGLFEL
ncbi:hypothetical protein J3R30DRAFT_3402943 [Lentinula aciculospora]|uniref:Uncharacterized protein n=1 Tax=Lentinula aciculospora TaxID=153920 RepID=A0A9W9AH04_9AGAR|nr:hypothetical protein J3R30DRAFT_3402943 [Lentinula aciculospora]